MSDGKINEAMLELIRKFKKAKSVEIEKSDGYNVTVFKSDKATTVHMLAADFDTDIDHKLDEMRFHRSRVNFINKVAPIGVTQTIVVKTDGNVEAFTPFNEKTATVTREGERVIVTLPEPTSYLILKIS